MKDKKIESDFDGESLERSFQAIDFSKPSKHPYIIEVLVSAFNQRGSKPKKQHVLEVLRILLRRYSFDLDQFFIRYHLTDMLLTRFVSYLLYEIYYRITFFSSLDRKRPQNDYLEYFFLTLMAEAIEEKKIQTCLADLSDRTQLLLISHCCRHLREGSWTLLKILELKHKEDPEWILLITRMRDNYYDPEFLNQLVYDLGLIKINSIIPLMEEHTDHNIREIQITLHQLQELIITVPVRRYIASNNAIPNAFSEDQEAEIKKQAEKEQSNLSHRYATFFYSSFTIDELKTFFKIYGLHGYFLKINRAKKKHGSLDKLLKKIQMDLQDPLQLSAKDEEKIQIFMSDLLQKLYTLHRDPQLYLIGLKRLVYSVSTRGEQLSQLAWLPSVVQGLHKLFSYMHDRGIDELSLKDMPIIIFDQAAPKQFAANRLFIKSLMTKYQAVIWHLSVYDTLRLAKKLRISTWIRMAPHGGGFGYGNSRNCVFLLAPVIDGAFKKGIKTLEDLLKMKDEDLFEIFDQSVLGKSRQDAIISPGEDDVAIPASHFFTDAIQGAKYQHSYFMSNTNYIGRATDQVFTPLTADITFQVPFTVLHHTRWNNNPKPSGMKGMLTKPRFCLPVHLGNEEAHSVLPVQIYDYFQPPVIHFGGTRYPKKNWPLSPFDGLLGILKVILPYAFQVTLSDCLTDSVGKSKRCIFPWNERSAATIMCHNLEHYQRYVFSKATQEELRKRFWKSMNLLFGDSPLEGEDFIYKQMQTMLQFDASLPISPSFSHFYLKMKREATLFFAFGKGVLDQHNKGALDPLSEAKGDFERAMKIKVDNTIFVRDLYYLIESILTFGTLSLGDNRK